MRSLLCLWTGLPAGSHGPLRFPHGRSPSAPLSPLQTVSRRRPCFQFLAHDCAQWLGVEGESARGACYALLPAPGAGNTEQSGAAPCPEEVKTKRRGERALRTENIKVQREQNSFRRDTGRGRRAAGRQGSHILTGQGRLGGLPREGPW